ncbi:pectinesterase inhibitor 4-like [Senna tora]|uniref:Pectinesterase inhibitor 4-like n=1 Tax=Senna tora TaxID=362788 RepID=A0A834TM57_9FABA|nr:pectinesterase inhibitor 4-like [Senna tora]
MEAITIFTAIVSFSLLSFTTSAWDYSSIFYPRSTPHFSQNYAPTPAPSPSPSPNPNHESQTYKLFILNSCNSSTYPSICYQSLSPFASKIRSDPFTLCNVSLSLALKAAVKTRSVISDILNSNLTATATVLRDCLENVEDSVEELKESLEEMAHLVEEKRNDDEVDRAFRVSTIQTAVSAAITDDSTCSDGFDEENVDGGVREKIRKSVLNVERMTTLKETSSASTSLKKLSKTKGLTHGETLVIKDCLENINDAFDEVKQCATAIKGLNGSSSEQERFQWSNIQTWMSAAITDDSTCTDEFDEMGVRASLQKKISTTYTRADSLIKEALALVNKYCNNYY